MFDYHIYVKEFMCIFNQSLTVGLGHPGRKPALEATVQLDKHPGRRRKKRGKPPFSALSSARQLL